MGQELNLISATVVAHSRIWFNKTYHDIISLEVVLPRIVLAELNTHRLFGRNSASSRAIPFNTMGRTVHEMPFIPLVWQRAHKGMQGSEYFTDDEAEIHRRIWLEARDAALEKASALHQDHIGGSVTKQICNRLLEPFMWHKVLITATEWENFLKLRGSTVDRNPEGEDTLEYCKEDEGLAEKHIMLAAEAIRYAIAESTPVELKPGEYHTPYMTNIDVDLSTKIKCSIASAARTSYTKIDGKVVVDIEKDTRLYNDLWRDGHLSPMEHVARAMTMEEYLMYTKTVMKNKNITLEKGWCDHLRGFISARHLISGGYEL